MKRRSTLLIAAFVGALGAMPAGATDWADLGAVSKVSWTGVYTGIQGGYQRQDDKFQDPQTIQDLQLLGINLRPGKFDFDGAVLGGHLGYDHQIGQIVLGIVGDIEWAGGSGRGRFGPGLVFGQADANWQASLRGRVGYAWDHVLIYGTGGLAFGNYDFDYTCCGQSFGIGDQFSDTLTGYTVGGGAAVALSNTWNLWAEYRFTDYDGTNGQISACCAPAPNSQKHEVTSDTFRIGLSTIFAN